MKNIETNRIEYKSALTKELDLEKEVVAFLNYHEGGIIYIGIDESGSVLGVADLDNDMLRIKERIKNNTSSKPRTLIAKVLFLRIKHSNLNAFCHKYPVNL